MARAWGRVPIASTVIADPAMPHRSPLGSGSPNAASRSATAPTIERATSDATLGAGGSAGGASTIGSAVTPSDGTGRIGSACLARP